MRYFVNSGEYKIYWLIMHKRICHAFVLISENFQFEIECHKKCTFQQYSVNWVNLLNYNKHFIDFFHFSGVKNMCLNTAFWIENYF